MPKIKIYKAHYRDEHEQWEHYENYDIYCNAAGNFYTTIKDGDRDLVKNLISNNDCFSLCGSNKLQSYSLHPLEHLLDKILQEKKTLTTKEQFIIEYAFTGEIAYVKDENGKIYPNGEYCPQTYKWTQGAINENSPRSLCQTFSVAITARASKIVKLYNRNGEFLKEVLETPTNEELQKYPTMKRLNEYRVGGDGFLCHHNIVKKRMPYSDNAAEFFINALKQMCLLYDRLNTFFGDDEGVKRAIDLQNNPLLLESHNADQTGK